MSTVNIGTGKSNELCYLTSLLKCCADKPSNVGNISKPIAKTTLKVGSKDIGVEVLYGGGIGKKFSCAG